MRQKAVLCVVIGQLCLAFFIFICFLLIPHFLLESDEGGISNYGVHAKTIVPYTLAFGSSGVLTILAAQYLPKEIKAHESLKRALILLGFLYMAVLATTYPYKINHTFNDIHVYAGMVLVVSELLLGAWFAVILARDHINVLLWTVQLATFVLAVFNYFGTVHALFVIELLTGLTFGILLVRTVRRLTDQDTT